MLFIPPSMSVSDTYVFVVFPETTLLKYWCLPVEIFDDLELYIHQTRVWSNWEILFRELGRKVSLSDGAVGADEAAEVAGVVKRLGDHISLMPEGPAKRLKQHAIRERVKENILEPISLLSIQRKRPCRLTSTRLYRK